MTEEKTFDCRGLFSVPAPGAEGGGYFRSHSVGLQPRSVPGAIADRVLAPWSQASKDPWIEWTAVLDGFRGALADFLGGRPEDYCQQANLSSALTKILFSLPQRTGRKKIVLCRDDFPTMGFVLAQARRAGYELVFVEPGPELARIEGWLPHLGRDVALLHLTHVFSNTGLKTPVAEVSSAARALGIVTVVDAAQSAGVVPVRPAEWDADAVLGTSVKYLCGGTGAAFMWIREETAETLFPMDVGWFSHQDPFAFDIERFDYARGAARFTGGTQSVLPLAAATEGLRTLRSIGADRIHGRVMALFDRAMRALPEEVVISHREDGEHGAAFLFEPPGGAAQAAALAASLAARGFAFDSRAGALRFSFHAYTSEAEVDALTDALDEGLGEGAGGKTAHACGAGPAQRRDDEDIRGRSRKMTKAKAVGINHVSIEVGDIEEAIAFYTGFVEGELDDVGHDRASLEMGDQFLAMTLTAEGQRLTERHFGLVVSDAAAARAALEEMGATILPGRFLRIRDPWNNLVEVVDYRNVRFRKTEDALARIGLPGLGKNEKGEAALAGMRASIPHGAAPAADADAKKEDAS